MEPFTPEPLPIQSLEWEPLIPLMGKANRALASYDGMLAALPNPDLLLTPLATREAVLSSKIEGTQATIGEVLKFEGGEAPTDPQRTLDIAEILNYRRALKQAQADADARPFSLNRLLELHRVLMSSVRGQDKRPGVFRTTQNWIGAPGADQQRALFVPPSPLHLQQHLRDWERYFHAEDRDVVVQLAVVHAQFEILHPFLDGNGRLGRMLIPLFLHERKVLSRPAFYLSAWLEAHREQYYHCLRELGREPGAWNRWCQFFLAGVVEQAEENRLRAQQALALYNDLKQQMLARTNSQFAVPLLDFMFARPVFRAIDLAWPGPFPSRPTLSEILRALVGSGIVAVIVPPSGRTPAVYALPALINLCEGREVVRRPGHAGGGGAGGAGGAPGHAGGSARGLRSAPMAT